MTSPSKNKSRLSAVILALAAVAGIAVIAMTAMPERIVWSDAGVPRLGGNLSTLTDRAAGFDPAPLKIEQRPVSATATSESILPPRIAPEGLVTAELVKSAASKFAHPAMPLPEAAAPAKPEIEAERLAAGVIRSQDRATLASRMTALIISMPLEAGQTFKRGETLVAFDCSQLQAQLKAADAAVAAYKTTYDTNMELDQYKAIGINEVRVSRANVNKAAAEADALRAVTTQCRIDAPFDGSVVERKANRYDVAAIGQPLMIIQSNGKLEVELIVSSSWLMWIEPGNRFSFHLEETGQRVEGTVSRLGATVDPVSKTIRVVGEIKSQGKVMPGMSGVAHFDASEPAQSEQKDAYVKRL